MVFGELNLWICISWRDS